MEKNLYIIRHCEAEGQPLESKLTEKGIQQSIALSEFFSSFKIERVISSPFLRAIQTVEPIIETKQLTLETDNRLAERILSSKNLPNWLELLKDSFTDLNVKLEGGESSQEAMNRIVEVIEEIDNGNTIIVTHGNILSLLLKYYDTSFGFENWKKLSNPDVYLLKMKDNHFSFERIWKE